ncbi:hypothetical protein EDB80DRAFT_756455 [Ilyonectria destructans]|nr:hypothetical protein EDB80DRAFT_756455 [Ilyonectria destructans]
MPGSSSWIGLTTALPLGLQHAAADVAKAVWREVGGIEVGQLDHWWHVARLSYIARADGLPEALILNCVEGEPDHPSQSAAYTVDIMRRRVKIKKGQQGSASIPADCIPLLDRIQEWVERIPERKEEARRNEERAQREAQERQRLTELERQQVRAAAIEAYEHRLADFKASQPAPAKKAKLEVKPLVTSVSGVCLDCAAPLAACKKCELLSCPQAGCSGQGRVVDPLKPLLAACSACNEVLCAEQLLFCDGKEDKDTPAHDIRVICCLFCQQEAEEEGDPLMFICIGDACPARQASTSPKVYWWCECGKCAERILPKCPSCDLPLCPTIRHQACAKCKAPSSCKHCLPTPAEPERLGESSGEESDDPLDEASRPTGDTATAVDSPGTVSLIPLHFCS